MTDAMFQQHCYVVPQHDVHWPYLTCRETLQAAAALYQAPDDAVDLILTKMGLATCAETRNTSLSGGQKRRLSIGLALLKKPTVLFLGKSKWHTCVVVVCSLVVVVRCVVVVVLILSDFLLLTTYVCIWRSFSLSTDEPTSGLDAAAATNIMHEIVRVARAERLIIICTIHQPSTKIYNEFDQLMIMSRGRPAFVGNVQDAVPYFTSLGYKCPSAMNPAEFFLDLVNSDFSRDEDVKAILDAWEEQYGNSTHHSSKQKMNDNDETDVQDGVVKVKGTPLATEIGVVFSRHARLIVRDPILYVGRCVIFLFMNSIFSFVYWNARGNSQDQVFNKFWIQVWFVGVPSNMGVVAVYALNEEFKTILRESKNGMISPFSYILSKTILVLPIFFVFGFFALGIPLYAVQDAPGESFHMVIFLYAVIMFVFESVAECLSVWVSDPILGMLCFMNFWCVWRQVVAASFVRSFSYACRV